MKTQVKVDLTRTFYVCDSSGAKHEIHEFTTFNQSVAGGRKDFWFAAGQFYKTPNGGNVSHDKKHNQFQLLGTSVWLNVC